SKISTPRSTWGPLRHGVVPQSFGTVEAGREFQREGHLPVLLAERNAAGFGRVPLAFGRRIPAVQTEGRGPGREPGGAFVRGASGDAEIRADYTALLHPRLVRYCQVGRRACLGDHENRTAQASGPLRGLLLVCAWSG